MYVFVFFLALSAILWFSFSKIDDEDLAIRVACFALIFSLIAICMAVDAVNPNDDYAFIAEVNSIQTTIVTQRQQGISELERAALTPTIISINQRITEYQFDNTTQWDLWTRDTIMTLKPIE